MISTAARKAVFLDRDGVLNEAVVRNGKPYPPASLDEIVIPADVPDAIRRLRENSYRLIIVTNQPDIARGTQSREVVHAINKYLIECLGLDGAETCEHDDADHCDCRKPKPGLLLRAAGRDGIALSQSFMVGDRWRDVEAGQRAGCRTILIGTGYNEEMKAQPDLAVGSLGAAVDLILTQTR